MKRELGWLPSFVALGLVWGASFLFIELSLQSFTPIGIAFLRGLLGSISLLVLLVAVKKRLPNKISHWLHISVVALLLNSAPGFLFAFGQLYVSSVMAGILNSTTPIMTLLVILAIFRSQKVTLNQSIGIALGFIGVTLVSGVLLGVGENQPIGVLFLLSATLCYGISFPYAKKFVLDLPYDNYSLAAAQVTASAVLLFPFAILFGIQQAPITGSSIFGIVMLGFLGTGIAYIWNYRNIKLAGSAVASTVTYITPLVAVVLGFLILGESLRIDQLLGGIVVLVSSAMVQERLQLFRSKDK